MPRPTTLAAATAAVVLGVLVAPAAAQITSNATCLSQWKPLYNSKGQSPCLVASYLGGACNGGQYDVSALDPGQFYVGPKTSQANDCLCSTVYYSMIGACSTCQNGTIVSWTSWITNCNSVAVSQFVENIPPETAVPGWAYENVTISNTFNVQAALQDNSPESSATQVIQTTGRSSTTSSATSTPTSSGGSNTGAIAGGVVGGVVGAAALALVAFMFLRRRRNNNNKSNKTNVIGSAYGGAGGAAGFNALSGGQGTPLMESKEDPYHQGGGLYSPPPAVPYTPGAYEQPKLYDPNDPSTFPTSPGPQSLNTQLTGQTLTSASAYQVSSAGGPPMPSPFSPAPGAGPNMPVPNAAPGGYRGVAEV